MKSLKKVLIIIIVILTVGLISGALVLARNQKREELVEVSTQPLESTNEVETEDKKEDEEIVVPIEQQEEKTEEDQLKNNNETIENELLKENPVKNDSVVNQDKTVKNNTAQNGNQSKSVQSNQSQSSTPQSQQINQETKPVEQSKPVEVKKEEPKPVVTTPVRTYKENTTYISKLRNTITATVENNLSSLNKYGITSKEQYIIKEDSSICAYNGGNRGGWTFENPTAYNTFVNSILKGTSLKIYAVDEYQNGEYIQTLCYYGH